MLLVCKEKEEEGAKHVIWWLKKDMEEFIKVCNIMAMTMKMMKTTTIKATATISRTRMIRRRDLRWHHTTLMSINTI